MNRKGFQTNFVDIIVIIDTLGDEYTNPRYESPFNTLPFFDFSSSDKTTTGIGLGKSYLWVDDALTDKPQLRMSLFDLDRSKLINEEQGLGYHIIGTANDDSEYKITVLIDPNEWFGSVFINDSLIWDEVGVMGQYNSDANKTSLWLPFSAVNLDYATAIDWKTTKLVFFLFDLETVSATNFAISHYFPAITSSFEQPKALTAEELHFEFTATNQRTSYPYDEFGTGCRFTSLMSYNGTVSWQESQGGSIQWPTNKASFDGYLNSKELPDMVNYDGSLIKCKSNFPYNTSASFKMSEGQHNLTQHDVLRLFTPVHNEAFYANAQLLLPADVVTEPDTYIDNVTIDPSTQQVTLSGESSCSAILNCFSEPDDIFNWTLTLTPISLE